MKSRALSDRNVPKPRPNRRKMLATCSGCTFLRFRLEQLEDRITPTINTWIGGSGLWSVDTNWDQGHAPITGEDVAIPNGATVTHSANSTPGGDVVQSIALSNNSTLILSGGSIESDSLDAPAGNTFTLSGGTLESATVTAATVISGTTSGGTLSGVTLDGTIDLSSSSNVHISVDSGLTLNGGSVLIGSNTGIYGVLSFDGGSQTLGGTGTVTFGTSAYDFLQAGPTAGSALTIGPGILVHGNTGGIGFSTGWGGPTNVTFNIQGTISADSAGGTITLNGTNWTNSGTIQASGAILTLAGSWSNTGTITSLGNPSLIVADPTGATEAGTTVTITTAAGHGFAVGESVRIAGVGLNGYNGTFTITSVPTSTSFTYTASSGLAASGGGTATLNSTLNLGGSFATATLGTVASTGGDVRLTGNLTNTGNNLALDANTGSWQLFGGIITGGTVTTTGGSTLIGTPTGGTLTNGVTLDGTLVLQTSNSNIHVTGGLTLAGASPTILIGDNANDYGVLSFDGGSQTLGGTGTVVFGNSFYNFLQAGPTAGSALTIGPGILVHGNTGGIGYHTGWGGQTNVTLTNQGTISADVSGGTITLNGNNWTNNGTIQATSGGSLNLLSTVSSSLGWTSSTSLGISGGGSLSLHGNGWTTAGITTTDSTLNLGDTFTAANMGTFTRTGGTVNITGTLTNTGNNLTLDASTGSWRLSGGTIDGGTVTTTGGSTLIGTPSGGTLANGVTLNGTLAIQTSNSVVRVTGGLTLAGASTTILIGDNAGNYGVLSFDVSQTLGGTGSVIFGTSFYNFLQAGPTAGSALTIGPGILVHGNTGGIGYHTGWGGPTNVTFTNQGTISADSANGTIILNGINWTNSNIVEAKNGGTVSGLGSTSNFAAGTLTGGTWRALANSAMRLIGDNIATNAATIILDGANSNFYSDTGTSNALATLNANTATGSFTVQNGRNLSTYGPFTNAGSLAVGAGSLFSLGYQYATSVIAFSSQYSTSSWSAAQTLGAPNTLTYGDIATAWAPSAANGNVEFLTLGFANPAQSDGVIVRETNGNGFVTQVDAIDTSDVSHTVWTGADPSQPGQPVDFRASWPLTSYAVKAVKVYIDTNHSNTYEEVDAVELAGPSTSFTQTAGSTTIATGGTLALPANTNFTQSGGTTTVNGQLSATGLVTFQDGALGGSGTIAANVTSTSQVTPGTSPGTLSINGNYTQSPGGNLNIEIGGLTAGTQYDQLSVSGSVTLDGGLNVTRTGGFLPAIGDSFRIIDQTGGGAVGGTFTSLPEGSTFFADSNSRFFITYAGGTGNDVVLTAINIAPTLEAIPDPSAILEDAGQQTINLAGIGAGGVESQTLTVTAVSSKPGLIPNPTVTYNSPNATGLLSYTPVANQSGTAVITVTVTDDGGTANGGINTFSRTFTVTVVPVNDPPTLALISNPPAILEDAGQQTINLSGISAGGGETQNLTVTATSSNPALIFNPTVTYTSPNATGTLSYTPASNLSGTAVITVTVTDDGGTANGGVNSFSRTFIVTVLSVNDPPTLDPISNPPTILEDAGQQTIDLTGISAGGGETQTLAVSATSSNPSLIPDPTVTYTSADSTGSLTYAPIGNLSGNAVITVTVTDDGGTANGGVNTFIRTFTIVVAPYNHELASSVDLLPLVSAPFFPVTWSGSVTSGTSVLAAFDIFVSTDGGPYTLWQHDTTATTAIFTGALGKDYRFFSTAIDTVGGREHPPATPDAETQTALFQRDLPPITEDNKNPPSVSISTLLGTAMTDADAGALRGIAVTGTSGSGIWQFSATGTTWTAIAGASETAAWLLPDSYKIRFLPAANAVGTAGLVFRGWDQTWGTPGKKIAIVTGELASPVSEAGGYVQATVTPVNDRPVLPTTPAPRLLPTPRSPTVPAGQLVSTLMRAATDVDGDTLGAAIIARTGTGDWQFSLNGGSTWTSMGSVSATSALLLGPTDLVRFVPTASATGSATLSVKAWDRTSGQPGDRVSTTVATNLSFSSGTTVATTLINGAPTLSGTNPTLTMPEDQSPNSGFLVSVLTAGRFSDDVGALSGIAITAADGLGHGTWQYSTNGTTWTAIGTVSASSALLLRSTDRVRFIPNADFNGSAAATLTFKAWDRTSGTAGVVADVSTFVAGAFFSSASLSATLNITSVADRPVVDTSVAPALDSFLPGGTPSSARIVDLLGNVIHDADSTVGPIAITATTGTGTWEFSLDGGTTWSAIGVIPAASGRLLDGDARIRFNASAAFHGVATFRFKAWDGTGGTVGSIAAIPASSTAFSAVIGTATAAVNVAPVLNPSNPIPLPAIMEDAKNPAGATVSSLLGSSISDPDGATALKGIAVTALTGTSNGTWQFSTNGGTNWMAVSTVSDAAALLLRSTDKLRFLPAANFHGQASATYRAWDQTSDTFGKPADASATGGSSAFSAATRTATVDVASINDAPTARNGYAKGMIHLPSVAVGATSPAGVKVSDLAAAGVVDVDGDELGIAVSGLTGTTKGQWQYSLTGTNWLNIGTVSATSALLLASGDYLRFVPNSGFNGSAQLTFRAWDQTKGVAHTLKPLTSSALTGSLSTTDFIALVWVNSSPVLMAS